ncbi:RidA family protein [Humitalea sp. 24SJ18S-53]|uniref:RidA family protein n=1 Tax=Humitalea sp. 24SJ18S-53 TaxID=3422307 RepID=UPI003D67E4B7
MPDEAAPEGRITGGKPWSDRYTYWPARRAGNLLFISGTTGTDDAGNITAPGDIVEQTRQVFRKWAPLLEEAGCTFDDIVQTVDHFTTTENYRGTAAVRREFFKRGMPTSTGVLVSGLLRPDALIEIHAIAVIPDAAR